MSNENTKQSSVKKQTTPKVQKPGKIFNSSSIIHYLNSNFQNSDYCKNITFKSVLPDKKLSEKSHVIDISKYEGFSDFEEIYNEVFSSNNEKNLSQQDKWKKFISYIIDFRLRGIMDIFNKYDVKKVDTDNGVNTLNEFILPKLHLPNENITTLQDYYNIIDNMFTNDSKLKIKVFNNTFPHGRHDGKSIKELKNNNENYQNPGINKIYLQHLSKYHDELLEKYINGETSLENILMFTSSEYIRDLHARLAKEKYNKKDGTIILNSLKNPKIIKSVINSENNSKNIQLSELFEYDGKQETENKLNSREKTEIRLLYRELNIVKSFYKILESGKNYENLSNEDFAKCYENYNNMLKEFKEFYEKNKQREQSELDFIEYFMETCFIISKNFKYETKTAIKMFIKDLQGNKLFKFSSQFKKLLVEQYNVYAETEKFDSKVFENVEGLINVRKPEIDNIYNTFSKIGSFINSGKTMNVPKNIRVSIGIAIVDYILQYVNIISTLTKKNDIVIYIKTGLEKELEKYQTEQKELKKQQK